MTVAALDTALLVRVEQILEGDALCYCGRDAAFVVRTDPDDEPGPVCRRHAREWIAAGTRLVWRGA